MVIKNVGFGESKEFTLPIIYFYITHYWLYSKFTKLSSANLLRKAIHQTKVPPNFLLLQYIQLICTAYLHYLVLVIYYCVACWMRRWRKVLGTYLDYPATTPVSTVLTLTGTNLSECGTCDVLHASFTRCPQFCYLMIWICCKIL